MSTPLYNKPFLCAILARTSVDFTIYQTLHKVAQLCIVLPSVVWITHCIVETIDMIITAQPLADFCNQNASPTVLISCLN